MKNKLSSLMISAPNQNPGLLIVHGNGITEVVDRKRTTGYTVHGDKLYRSIQHQNFCEIQLIKKNRSMSYIFNDLKDIHDIKIINDKLYIVSTGTNEIAIFDLNLNLIDVKKFPGNGDAWHINCLVQVNDIVCVTAFCASTEHYAYKGKTKNSGFLIDIESRKVLIDKLSQPHSPLVIDNMLVICDSETERLLVYDDFRLAKKIDLGGYARGLSFDKHYIFVGLSKSRNASCLAHGSAKIIILDRATFKVLDGIELPCDEIYQISNFDICNLDIKRLNFFNLYDQSDVDRSLRDATTKIDKELEQAKRGLQAKDKELEQTKQGLQAKDKELEQIKRELIAMHLTSSWKMTRPLRKAKSMFRLIK